MNGQDLFVGGVSAMLGASALAAALFNWEWCYQLKKTRWLESRWGRSGARWIVASVGVMLILLGVAIASGVRWYGGKQTLSMVGPAAAN